MFAIPGTRLENPCRVIGRTPMITIPAAPRRNTILVGSSGHPAPFLGSTGVLLLKLPKGGLGRVQAPLDVAGPAGVLIHLGVGQPRFERISLRLECDDPRL